VDVKSGEAIWPEVADGYPVTVETPLASSAGEADNIALRRALAIATAQQIAELFYKRAPEE